MRALVTSAFALTLLLSAVTVYFALRSDSLDGEPYVSIPIDPPGAPVVAARPKAVKVTRQPPPSVAVPASEPAETVPVETVAKTVEITPAAESAKPAGVRTTGADEPASPVSSSAAIKPAGEAPEELSGPLLLPADQGFGLGVGNLGPLDTATTTN